jgi:hypothetical protein
MSRLIANSSIYKDTFETLLLKVTELSHAFSREVITANTNYANTGSPSDYRNAQLYGKLSANTLVATNGIRGGNTSTSDNLNFSSNCNISGTIFHQNNYIFDSLSNTNIGVSTVTPIKVFSFNKTEYSSGKFNVQIRNGANTQLSEIVLAHNTSNSYISTYASISSPPSANSSLSLLGNFSSNINGANVELLILQNNPSSSVTVVANLIK